MNLLLIEERQLSANNQVVLTGRPFIHLQKILHTGPGDRLRVGKINGSMGFGRVLTMSEDRAELEVELLDSPPPPLPLILVLALPRPKMLKRILQTIATLGVKQLHLINSYRVEKSYWQSPWLEPSRMRQQLILGLEQGRDTLMPEVTCHQRFKPFAEDILPSMAADSLALVAHPCGSHPCPQAVTGPITLAVGPEGGFIDYELEKFRDAGLQSVTLGPRILRVETAIPVLLSRLFN